jgi:hypothetical protein
VAQPVGQYDEYDERDGGFELTGERREEEPPRGGLRLLPVVLTLAVMALFAGGVWFAYVQGTRQAGGAAQSASAVPLLRADERPTKVKPEQPGGMPMPDQNISLYNDKLAKSPVEKLLPPPEQPLPRPAPAKPTAAPQIVMPPPEAGTAEAGPRPAMPSAAAPQSAAPPAAQKAALAPPGAQKVALPPGGPAAGTVQVRLGSLPSPEAAREEWQRLKRQNGDLLGNLRANAVAVDLGEKGIYYRILAGPLDEAAAERLCGEMKRRSLGCIIAR